MARRGRVSLSQADAKLASIEEQIARLRAQQESMNEARLSAIAEDVMSAIPEVRDGDYGDDLVGFLTALRADAMAYRELEGSGKSEPAPSNRFVDDVDDLLDEDLDV